MPDATNALPADRPGLPAAQRRVLVVDDEAPVRETVASALTPAGYIVDGAPSLQRAKQMLVQDYALVVLDLMFPGENGFDLLEWLRTTRGSQVPVVLLSGVAREEDKLRAFELGADDYIVKPFSPRELEARVKAVLRRYYGDNSLNFGPFQIDAEAHILRRNGEALHLRPKEFEILLALRRRAGQVLGRDELFSMIWGNKPTQRHQAVAVAVYSLRQKIEDDPLNPRYLRTVARVGYRLDI